MRLMLKILKYLLLAIASLAVFAVVIVETGYFKDLLKNELTSRFGPLTGGTFTVEKLSGNIFTGVALEGVRLAGTGGRFFYSERITASYSLPALIAGKIYLTRVSVYKPFFTIGQDASGRWSYEGLFPKSKTPEKGDQDISVILSEVRVNDGSVSLKYRDKPATLDITGVYLSASAGISGDTSDIVIKTLRAQGVSPALAIKAMSGNVRLKGPGLNIEGLRIKTEYSRINIDGTVTDLARPAFDFEIDCPEVSLKDIGALMPGVMAAGAFASAIRVTGSLDEFKVSQILNYNSLKIHNEVVVRPGIPFVSVNSRIRGLKPCDIMPMFGEYEKESCPAGEFSMDVSARAEGKNFDELRSSVSVTIHPSVFAGSVVGESTIAAEIGGRLASLDGELEISGERYFISVNGEAGKQAFRLDKLKIQSAHFGLASKGVLGYDSGGALNLVYNIESSDLRRISVFLPALNIKGIISSTGTLKGTMGSPGISAELEGRNISFSGFSAEKVKAEIALAGPKLLSDGTADIRISGLRSGSMVFDGISARVQNRKKSSRFELSAEKSPDVKFTATGGVTEKGKGDFSVNINKMKISAGTSTWSNEGNIMIVTSGKQVRVESLRISNGRQLLSVKGIIGRVQNINMKVNVDHADISSLNFLTGLGLPLEGTLSAVISVEGSYLLPLISGVVDIRGASAGGLSFDRIPATFNYAEKILRFDARVENGGKILFSADGTVPVDLSFDPVKNRIPRKGLRVSIKSSGLGLDIFPVLTEQVKSSSGRLMADILIDGNLLSPRVQGNIDISDGAMTLFATGTEYRDINANIALDGKDIIIRRLALKSGGGTAEVTGKIMLKGFVPSDADLDLKCRGFKVMNTKLFTGNIDSDIKINGLSASGTMKVTHGKVNIPSQARTDISEIEFVQAGPGDTVVLSSSVVPPTLFKLLILDIRVLIPGDTWVYGPGVIAEIKADLNVTKKKDGPMSYAGEIDILQGVYKINDRTLTITEGKIIPRGSDFMASLIRAKASCKIADVSIDVILGGTLDNPIITFQSDPPMARNDIISYLAFGAPSDQLSQPQSSSLKNTSFDILAGFAEKNVKGVIGKVVPIDEVSLKPSEGSWGVGKHITDKLFAKYEWRSGQEGNSQTILDYMLDRHFSLNSQFGNPKTSGVNIFWRYGY